MGSIMGCFLGALLVDRLGYKKTILGGLVCLVPFIGLVTFAPNLPALLIGEMSCGVSWGIL